MPVLLLGSAESSVEVLKGISYVSRCE
jgi:hypothetical protein